MVVATATFGGGNTTVVVYSNTGVFLDSGLTAIYTGITTVLNNALPVMPTNTKTTNYQFLNTDTGQIFTANSASAIAFTLPSTSGLSSGWNVRIKNINTGVLTITGTVDGVSNPTLNQNDEISIFLDQFTSSFRGSKIGGAAKYSYGPSAAQGLFKNLRITNGATPATQIAVTADEVVLEDSSNNYFTARNVSVTILTGSSNVPNGLDTGSLAGPAWYRVYVIYNPTTTTVAGLISLADPPTTLPSGYTFWARVGWVLTDGAPVLRRTMQIGRKFQWVVSASANNTTLPLIVSGINGDANSSAGVATWSSTSLNNFVPPTASRIMGVALLNVASKQLGLAPNAQYGGSSNTSNPPPVSIVTPAGVSQWMMPFDFEIEVPYPSQTIQYACNNANAYVWALGYEDNI
jgi:hypothetical protein